MIVEIRMGDWSSDGHGITSSKKYEINLPWRELEEAFAKGTELVGFNLSEQCEEYEDSSMSVEYYEQFKAVGGSFQGNEEQPDIWEGKDTFFMSDNLYALMYMKIAQLGNLQLEFKPLGRDVIPIIDIGGYGLFAL